MDIFKRKDLIDEVIAHNAGDHVKLLSGVRGAGKTTMLKSLMEELRNMGVSEENVICFSFSSSCFRDMSYRGAYGLLSDRIKGIKGKKYLFFDDVEQFEHWQSVLDSFRKNPDCEVFAAVNYSKFYRIGDRYPLGGKSFVFEVWPFSFREFVEYKREFCRKEYAVKELFREYLRYGGMPDIVTEKNPSLKFEYLENIKNIVKYQDLVNDSNLDGFLADSFMTFMIENFTGKLSKKQINRNCYNLFDDVTLSESLCNLKNSSFIKSSKILNDGGRFRWDEKCYLIDHGFFNQLHRFHCDFFMDEILRNVIYIELLRRRYRVFFSDRHGKFMDFICLGNGRRILIQFDYLIDNESILQRETDSFNCYGGDWDRYIITTGDYDFSAYGVRHLNVIDFLLGDEI